MAEMKQGIVFLCRQVLGQERMNRVSSLSWSFFIELHVQINVFLVDHPSR